MATYLTTFSWGKGLTPAKMSINKSTDLNCYRLKQCTEKNKKEGKKKKKNEKKKKKTLRT
jgi:hypothetical protein